MLGLSSPPLSPRNRRRRLRRPFLKLCIISLLVFILYYAHRLSHEFDVVRFYYSWCVWHKSLPTFCITWRYSLGEVGDDAAYDEMNR